MIFYVRIRRETDPCSPPKTVSPHFLLIRNLTRDGQYQIRSRRTK